MRLIILISLTIYLQVTLGDINLLTKNPLKMGKELLEKIFSGAGGKKGSVGNTKVSLHPLDPLTESEITSTTSIIKNHKNGDWIFNFMTLKEPEKSILLPYFLNDTNPPSSDIPRRSFTVLLDPSNNVAHEVIVNLDTKQVESWDDAPVGVTPTLTPEEMIEAEEIAVKNTTVQERCKQMGWTNMSLVKGDAWSMGYVGDRPEYKGKRLIQLYYYGQNFEHDNHYAHPFDFIVIVDMLKKEVINIEELASHDDFDVSNKDGATVPSKTKNFLPELSDSKPLRKDLKPLKITQPGGPSYTSTGNEISWQKFKMRLGFNGREGLVIYNVNYNDSGKVRPLFYRMSLAEMFIPYGDPRPPYHRKHVFDGGEYGVGFSSNQLRPNLDCIGEVKYIDAVLNNQKGGAKPLPRAVCVREEDAGLIWTHTDYRNGKNARARSQRLAITFIATVGNYDYVFSWNFYQDATIEFNVKLTGILSVNLLAVNSTPAGHGSVVLPQVNAHYHQHFFGLRIDPEIDGNHNSVTVSDVVPGPGDAGSDENPYGQGFTTKKRYLKTTGAARTNVAPEKSRTWIISNTNSINEYTKEPVAWKLKPSTTPPLYLQNESPIHAMAEWLDYHTWVTPYKENQMFPGGFYVNKSGLPEWVGKDEFANIENTDIVIWHNLGLSHIPRVEDFPVMPVESCSVFLKPYNFFLENPAIDVAPPRERSKSEL